MCERLKRYKILGILGHNIRGKLLVQLSTEFFTYKFTLGLEYLVSNTIM